MSEEPTSSDDDQKVSSNIRPSSVPDSDSASPELQTTLQIDLDDLLAIRMPEGRRGTKLVGAHFPPEVSRNLRLLAAAENIRVQDLIKEGLNAVFAKRNWPQIR